MTASILEIGARRHLPFIRAAEAAECALACLAMISRHAGHDVDLNGLRQRFSISLAGATLRSVMQLADELGFANRAIRVELDDLSSLRLPAILHWDLNHFVVLKSVDRHGLVVHDPARGVRRLKPAEASKHFTGVALELQPSEDFAPVQAKAPLLLRELWSKVTGVWAAGSQVLVLSLVLQLLAFSAPLGTQLLIDEGVNRGDIDTVYVVAIGIALVLIAQVLGSALRSWTLLVLGSQASFQMTGDIVRHLLRLPAEFFERRHLGDILSRMGSAAAIREALTNGVISGILDGAMAVASGVVLFLYSPILGMIVVCSLIIQMCISIGFYPILRKRLEEQLVSGAKEQTYLMETVRAATIIKIMGHEAVREGAWRNLFSDVVSTAASRSRIQIINSLANGIVGSVQHCCVIAVGASLVLKGEGFSIGMFFAFLTYRQIFSDRIGSLISLALQFRMLSLHLDRLADIVKSEPEPRGGDGRSYQYERHIELRDVCYRYGATDPEVLKGVNLEVAPGDFVALTGPSGGGKTTLLKLMIGLIQPTEGQILLDGRAATPETWRAWRRQVGVVSQDDRLLSGSIAENIAFFDPDLDMRAVQEAAEWAQIHSEIMQKPMQYRSLIGDMGSMLSGGQRQRLLLARALYRRPELLMFDEGTANLDEQTEEVIANLLSELPITRVVVAHRPALIRRAHHVLCLRNGRLELPGGPRQVLEGVL